MTAEAPTDAPPPGETFTVTLPSRPLFTTSGTFVLLGGVAVAEMTVEGGLAKVIADSLNANPAAAGAILVALMAPPPEVSPRVFLPLGEMVARVAREGGAAKPLSPGLTAALEAVGADPDA